MKKVTMLAAAAMMLLAAGCGQNKKQAADEGQLLPKENFETEIDGVPVSLYTLKGGDITMQVTNFGGRVVTLLTPDKNGVDGDIVIGKKTIDDYANPTGERFLGACVGPVANRIGGAKFTIDGVEYKVPANDHEVNTLHGGFKGFDMVPWWVIFSNENRIIMRYSRPDGFEGYPGLLEVTMSYTLTKDNKFVVEYTAVTDKATPVNISHHSFFNLRGEGDVLDYVMTINASQFTPIDELSIPLGKNENVEGTPFDFREPHAIGERIDQTDNQQIANAKGYDHNWVLDHDGKSKKGVDLACTVWDPVSGRTINVYTDQPGIQFYSGNFFNGSGMDKNGMSLEHRSSIALETQHFPDSPNRPNFPSVILDPDDMYHHVCIYEFGVRDE